MQNNEADGQKKRLLEKKNNGEKGQKIISNFINILLARDLNFPVNKIF